MVKSGDKFGPYTLLRELGRGAFGVVWLADRRTTLATMQVAVKLPLFSEPDLNAIAQEAQLWVRASGHPNVISVIEAEIYDGQVVIASEYAADGSLDGWMKKHGNRAPTIDKAISMTCGVLDGLVHLHARGIIHRDLKPANVLLQGESPKIADFGLARVLKSINSANAAGTPTYMAPEAWDGERTERTDIWAVGVIFYEMLAGRIPFSGPGITAVMRAIIEKEPELLPSNVPAWVSKIVLRALNKDSSLRYQSAAEMLSDLRSGEKQASTARTLPPTLIAATVTKTKPKNLPYGSIGTLFKGRDESLDNLRKTLLEGGKHASALRHAALHGLGGVGKTRAAIEFALQNEEHFSALLFVAGDSPDALQRNLAGLCGAMVLNLPQKDATEDEAKYTAALGWLREHSGWFLIVDNVDNDSAAQAVEDLLAQLNHGHVLITTRLQDWGSDVEALGLDVLEKQAAADFLLARTQGKRAAKPTDVVDAQNLAAALDCLALALEQAGAFVCAKHASLADYLKRWKDGEEKVKTWFDAKSMKYSRSVAVTWDASFNQLTAAGKALLQMLSWFAPDPIPRDLFETTKAKEELSKLVQFSSTRAESALGTQQIADLEDALADLNKYSLLKWDDPINSFHIHRLVQEITRTRLAEHTRQASLLASMTVVNEYLPCEPKSRDVRSWPRWDPLIEHLKSLLSEADASKIFNPTSRVMNDLGALLGAKCAWGEAEFFLRHSLAIDEQNIGMDDPKVASDIKELAWMLYRTNRHKEAEPLMWRALSIDERVFGKEHSNLARHLSDLGCLMMDMNRLGEAEPLLRRALSIDEKCFGMNHSNVAICLVNLALVLKTMNRLEEAERLIRRGLAIDEKTYGEDHPEVAIDLDNLAGLLKATNRLEEAEPLMRRALAINEHSYGNEHPTVAINLDNLAGLLIAANRLAEAERLSRRALVIDEQSYGKCHPRVATDMDNLGQLLQFTNRSEEAEPLMRRALAIDVQSFGEVHPSVSRDLNNLAGLLHHTNRLKESIPLSKRAIEILLSSKATNGYEHPNLRKYVDHHRNRLRAMGRSDAEIITEFKSLAELAGVIIDDMI